VVGCWPNSLIEVLFRFLLVDYSVDLEPATEEQASIGNRDEVDEVTVADAVLAELVPSGVVQRFALEALLVFLPREVARVVGEVSCHGARHGVHIPMLLLPPGASQLGYLVGPTKDSWPVNYSAPACLVVEDHVDALTAVTSFDRFPPNFVVWYPTSYVLP